MRRYTTEEANGLLAQILPVLQRLRIAVIELRTIRAGSSVDGRGASADGAAVETPSRENADGRIVELTGSIQDCVDLLEGWGVLLKDPERGLIDFYHDRRGETVFLCYQLGEPNIGHWHSTADGFAGRKPL
jgi:hypothetical protein